jgi:hypothetical protein
MEAPAREPKPISSTERFQNYIFDKIGSKIIEKRIPAPTNFLKGDIGANKDKIWVFQNISCDPLSPKDSKNFVSLLPNETQCKILNQAWELRSWIKIAEFCNPLAVEASAKDMLREMGQDYTTWDYLRGDTATEKVLHYFFDQMYESLSKEEVNKFFDHLNDALPTIEATRTKVQKITEKVLSTLSDFFSNKVIRFGVSIAIWITVYKGTQRLNRHIFDRYVPYAVNPIINHVPAKVIRVVSWMLDNKWKTFGAIYLIDKCFPSNPNSFYLSGTGYIIGKVRSIAGHVLWLPTTIANLPSTLGHMARRKTFPACDYSTQILRTGSQGLEVNRKAREVAKARQFWEKRITEIIESLSADDVDVENTQTS